MNAINRKVVISLRDLFFLWRAQMSFFHLRVNQPSWTRHCVKQVLYFTQKRGHEAYSLAL